MRNVLVSNAVLILLIAPVFAGVKEDRTGELKVGFAQTDITPAVGDVITGAGYVSSIGIEDVLVARTLVVQSGGRTIAVVGIDLVKIRYDLTEAAIAIASKRTGIEHDAVMICPTGYRIAHPPLAVGLRSNKMFAPCGFFLYWKHN